MATTRSVKVQVRHSPDCRNRDKGVDWKRCGCPKVLRVYEGGGSGANKRVATRTRSWEEAEKQAQELRDSWDPVKQELKSLKAERERQQVSIEKAVALYIANMIADLGDNGTVAVVCSLLGRVDSQMNVTSSGHLFNWLAKIPREERPVYVTDLTPTHLTEWRTTWKFNDLTAARRLRTVKGFFDFCVAQGWVKDNPAASLKQTVDRRNRTTVFSDQQYAAIESATKSYAPNNIIGDVRNAVRQRLLTFVKLLRWSGMDLIDAVQYSPDLVDEDGVLRYSRQKTVKKTSIKATVPLPEDLVALLRNVPLEEDSVGPEQPFRQKDTKPISDTLMWAARLRELFKLAGITKVRDQIGRARKPHAKMFRHTCAVGEILKSVDLLSVAKMLGHTTTKMTETVYLPWVQEMEEAHITRVREARAAAKPKVTKGQKVVNINR